jgi:hypothetical protein
MTRYTALFAPCQRHERISASDRTLARSQADHAAAMLVQLAEVFRRETAELDVLLRNYATEWLANSAPGGSA